MLRNFKRRRSGQGLTDFVIMVALVAVGSIAVVTLYGDNARKVWGASSDALEGQATTDTGAELATAESEHRDIVSFARPGAAPSGDDGNGDPGGRGEGARADDARE